ncbi:MAG: pyruvate formate-lyase [Clostridia bacterium]|nr:pyruvate formate-lyase [Clostridia bacterium]
MTERVQNLLSILQKREYRTWRVTNDLDINAEIKHLDRYHRDAYRFKIMLEHEKAVLFEGERIGFYRHAKDFPYYTRPEDGYISGWGFGNLTPNYERVLSQGLDAVLEEIREKRRTMDATHTSFLDALEMTVVAALALADRYREAAKAAHPELYGALGQVPHKPPRSFYEACVFMKFIIFTLRCNANVHLTIGRFDQYMLPYYQADLDRGVAREDLLDILEEFFVSVNFDTDLYQGMQQGDNGQSVVLGGYDANGHDAFNDLSMLCMEASMELNLIDPKINLRVNKETPFSLYLLGTHMTKQGLGFPQYSNDDVVIDGLVKLGYDYEDAVNYTVAACWEFIIPGCGADIPNFITMNFPKVVNDTLHAELEGCENYDQLWEKVAQAIRAECDALMEEANTKSQFSTCARQSPYLSLYIDGCLEKGLDFSDAAAKYNNYGCHGAGISNAADALAAVKKTVFEEKSIGKRELLDALERNFEGCEELRLRLLDCPKMGNNDDAVDDISIALMEIFSSYLNGKPNDRGGIFRAGTGSAMEYLLSASKVPATADGRRAFEPYASSFSPSLTARVNGPLSVLQSFTKFDMTKIINGGPLTIEIHDTTFRNEDGIEKVARLVQLFIRLKGHQLQINSINRDRLLDAQKHPEKYPNLIVRVWGWSGYFNELDLPYQNHIIRRAEFRA